uniref:N-acetylmuramoyl-L-alanine amidase n=1 Tax=Faecalicoccus acidiformans TaxID=915173 RepID=UPI003208180E
MFKFLKKSLSFVMILMLVTSLVSNVYALDFISSDNADTNEIVENQNLNQADEENAIEDSESEGSNNTEDKGSNLNDDSSVMENQADEKNVQSLQEQHNVEDSIPEEKNIIVQPGDSSLVEYFYVGSPYLTTPATQQFILSFGTGAERITSVKLEYQKDGEEELSLDVARQQSNLYVFERSFTEAESGTYKVNGFTYVIDNQTYEVSFSDLEMDIRFGVNQEYEGYGTAEGYTLDANGNEVQEESIDTQGLSEAEIDTSVVTLDGSNADQTEALVEDALQNNALPSVQSRSRSNSITTYSETNPLVICIDPGHGGNDSGTIIVNGAYEKNYNLKIAQYLKAELEQYKNVKVVMTRTGDTNPSLQQRAQIAADAGATALVSIHLNATGWGTQSTVAGAEVYYPSSNYNAATSTTGKNLAQNILNQLVGLGIQNRGIKVKYVYNTETGQPAHHPAYDYPDGSVGDYYGVIRYSKLVGVSGIIVEHCMADNWNDFNKFLSSEAKLKQLGVADATGIAKAFGLQKTPKAINYSVHCQTYGWMNTVGDGQTAGTTGQAKRLESIKISLGETGYSGGVQYRTHVQ